ncbi:MAG TPA: cytochrome P450 [Actinocrinis sp.]|nr:cytochrome P450 [Actinocrinis sp.]HEV2346245.1 cytochrome P450 [Actinocrinis sp.]
MSAEQRPEDPLSTQNAATPADGELTRNPYPLFARLREASPVSVMTDDDGLQMWLMTGYDDVRAALADPRLGQDARRAREIQQRRVAGTKIGADIIHMLNSDPPDHTRLRQLIHGAFTPGRIRAMRPMVEGIAARLLDGLAQRESADFVLDFALPLPMAVICALLGFPNSDRDLFRRWSTDILTDSGPDDFARATAELVEYFEAQIAQRRARPTDDLLTALVESSGDGRLTEREVVAMVYLLLIGGQETTVNLLGTALLALLKNPDQLADLRANPDILSTAVDEFLRYEAPVCMATIRFTSQPVDVRGVTIPEGELVMLSLGAANRDPKRFPDPDRLLVRRGDPGHLAFGYGIHRCLGSFLGRLEAEIALGGLLAAFPNIELAADEAALPWRDTIMLRGLESLPVALHG